MTSRRYVFTINNPEESEKAWLLDQPFKFIVFQQERGENGTIHFQGWVVFTTPVRVPGARTLLGGRAHVERQRGSDLEAYNYSTKNNTRINGPWETGIRPTGQGSRSDLSSIQIALEEGWDLRDIVHEHFSSYVRYSTGIHRARMLLRNGRAGPPEVFVFWGTTGTGKTRRAIAESSNPYVVTPPTGAGHVCWWDGYDLHEDVIIDEFYGWLPWSLLLRLLDRYPVRVRTNGGTVAFVARRIWITSNADPREWYREGRHIQWSTLARRITQIVHFNEPL